MMLELVGVARVNWDNATIDMQLSHHRCVDELRLKCPCNTTLTQAEEADKNVLIWILIAEERFPAAVSVIVASD